MDFKVILWLVGIFPFYLELSISDVSFERDICYIKYLTHK